jgi:hypothetical protein
VLLFINKIMIKNWHCLKLPLSPKLGYMTVHKITYRYIFGLFVFNVSYNNFIYFKNMLYHCIFINLFVIHGKSQIIFHKLFFNLTLVLNIAINKCFAYYHWLKLHSKEQKKSGTGNNLKLVVRIINIFPKYWIVG